jgi:hypothetical protein
MNVAAYFQRVLASYSEMMFTFPPFALFCHRCRDSLLMCKYYRAASDLSLHICNQVKKTPTICVALKYAEKHHIKQVSLVLCKCKHALEMTLPSFHNGTKSFQGKTRGIHSN